MNFQKCMSTTLSCSVTLPAPQVTSEVGEILQGLGWSVECRGEIYVKGKGLMTTYFVDPKSTPVAPDVPASSSNNNNNKASNDPCSERRRSSQLSLNSLKALLSSHRGSLDISTGKEPDTLSTKSLPTYKPIRNGVENPVLPDDRELTSVGTTPRGSCDSRVSEVMKESSEVHQPSQFVRENAWTFEVGDIQNRSNFNPSKGLQEHSSSIPTDSNINNVTNEIPKSLVDVEAAAALPSSEKQNVGSAVASQTSMNSSSVQASPRESIKSRASISSKIKSFYRPTSVRQVDAHPLALWDHEHNSHTSLAIDSDDGDVRL